MSPAQSHSLNETAIPIPENLFGQLTSSEPLEAIEIAKQLPCKTALVWQHSATVAAILIT